MGADHEVADLSTWVIPSGQTMGAGHYVTEGGTPTADTFGDWALAVNTLLEVARPPVVRDSPSAAWNGDGADSWEVIARYIVPVEHSNMGLTGSNGEHLFCRVYIRTDDGTGNQASVRFTTPTDSVTVTGIANETYDWVDVGTAEMPTTLNYIGAEITIEVKGASDGTAIDVDAIEVSWADTRTTLPNGVGGPYANGVMPCSVGAYGDVHNPIGTEQVRRLLRNLREIKSARGGGIVISSYLSSRTRYFVGNNNVITDLWRTLARQRQYTSTLAVWLYVTDEQPASVAVTVGEYSISVLCGTPGWHQGTVVLPENRNERERVWSVTVSSTDIDLYLQGCCIYWEPAGALR
jgi:hypothetical protein